MSVQRRRNGQPAKVWRTVSTVDRRGNRVLAAEEDGPFDLTVWAIPQRSSKAEVPGQQQINVIRIGFVMLPEEIKELTLWSRVEYADSMWDVAAPPAYHHGVSRHTRHWTVDLRERP